MSKRAKTARKNRNSLWSFLGVFILLFALIIFWPIKSDFTGIRLDITDAKSLTQGKRIYAMHCASCHGTNLEGQPNWQGKGLDGRYLAPPHDDSGHTWHHSDGYLIGVVKDGMSKPGYESNMPAYGEILTKEEVIAVLTFIKSQWSPEHQAKQEQSNEFVR